ncbi:hypothetical protein WCLP8_1100022 [uncultured Gammaproteobacteria bacterium]
MTDYFTLRRERHALRHLTSPQVLDPGVKLNFAFFVAHYA